MMYHYHKATAKTKATGSIRTTVVRDLNQSLI